MQGLQPLFRYFDFNGRSGRAEYWQWVLITVVAGWITGIADGLQSNPYEASHKFTIALYLGTAIPWLAVGMRRLHDVGKSGWYYGIVYIGSAVAAAIVLLGAAVKDRTGDDSYLGIGVAMFAVFLIYVVYIVILTIKVGDPLPNAYGEPPTPTGNGPSFAPVLAERAREIQSAFAAPKSGSSAIDPLAQIERLAKMKEAGVLTEEEFQQQKAAQLSRLT